MNPVVMGFLLVVGTLCLCVLGIVVKRDDMGIGGESRSQSSPKPGSGLHAGLIRFSLIRDRNEMGMEIPQVLIEWRNVNSVPVASVRADVRAYDASNSITYDAPDREIFRAKTKAQRVAPNATRAHRLAIVPLTAGRPTRVEVAITRVEAVVR